MASENVGENTGKASKKQNNSYEFAYESELAVVNIGREDPEVKQD